MTSPVCVSSIAICWKREWKSQPIISMLGSFLSEPWSDYALPSLLGQEGADDVIQSEVSSTAFDAQPPDLPAVSLVYMGFAVSCPLARHRRPPIRFLFIGSHLCSALLSGPASRRVLFHPCASLSLRVRHVVKRTYTS